MSDADDPPFTVEIAARYEAFRPSRGIWRQRARAVILEAVSYQDDLGKTPTTRREALALVDAAYPFGERAMSPYKAWLVERKMFLRAFEYPKVPDLAPPDVDEVGVCDVARDLIEEGRADEAAALIAQAPHRHGRECPACKAPAGWPCVDIAADYDALTYPRRGRPEIAVPHASRLVPPAPASGPLFEVSR